MKLSFFILKKLTELKSVTIFLFSLYCVRGNVGDEYKTRVAYVSLYSLVFKPKVSSQ